MKRVELLIVYVKFSLLFYEAILYGLKENSPELYKSELQTLTDMRKLLRL